MNVLVFGGSGGIGGALVEAFCARDTITSVTATYYRTPPQRADSKLQ